MASTMIVSRRSPAVKLVSKLLFPVRTLAASAPRSFTTSTESEDPNRESSIAVERDSGGSNISRRRGTESLPSLFSDVFDPFYPSRSLSQVLSFVDQLMENPVGTTSRWVGGGLRRGWDAREDSDGLYLRVDMPGLDKNDVKVTVEQNTLVIRGEGGKEKEDEEGGRRYSGRIDLPERCYMTDQIRAEMKNGVLKVFVPKAKEEERMDVVQVNVE